MHETGTEPSVLMHCCSMVLQGVALPGGTVTRNHTKSHRRRKLRQDVHWLAYTDALQLANQSSDLIAAYTDYHIDSSHYIRGWISVLSLPPSLIVEIAVTDSTKTQVANSAGMFREYMSPTVYKDRPGILDHSPPKHYREYRNGAPSTV